MDISFRGYNRKQVDKYIEQLKSEYEYKIATLNNNIAALNEEITEYKRQITELERNNKAVSDVLVDAVKHAQQIELDYKNRARQSDEHYCKMANEWESKMQACQAGLENMKKAAQDTYEDLITRIDQFKTWSSDNMSAVGMLQYDKITSASNDQYDHQNDNDSTADTDDSQKFDSDELQNKILSGINSDLSQACKELGIGE